MLVYWIPETTDSLPANASHRVGIGAFVMNSQRQVFPTVFARIKPTNLSIHYESCEFQLLTFLHIPNATIFITITC